MIGILAFVAVSQTPAVMSAEEINRRLEAPISYRTDPVRLPVALDEIGALVGVRIRCEAELQPAVVVVGFKGRPAKEAVQHLMNGIGAGSFIQNGTLHVGIRVTTEREAEKQKELELKAIVSTLENRAKQLKLDDPLDTALAARTAAQAQLMVQTAASGEYRPYYNMYGAVRQAPAYRASIGILQAVGPELLRTTDDRTKVVSMRDLTPEQQAKVREKFRKLEKEQAAWSEPFVPLFKMLANNQFGYVDDDLLSKAVSLKGSKPDSFQIVVTPSSWGRTATVEISSGGEPLFEVNEGLPKQRVYTDPGGEPFQTQAASAIIIPLGEKVQRLEDSRTPDKDNKPKPHDWNLMKLIADPWRNEPLAFTRAQPMADVMLKLNQNFATYLGDGLMHQLAYNYYGNPVKEVRGDQVMQFVNYGGISGLRKKGDWVIGYCSNPESYLENQVNRLALGKFLTLALKPGALSFDQFLAARKEMGANQLNIARQIARVVRPGFDSLNPINVDLLEVVSKLKPGMLNQMQTSGVPISNMPPDLQKRMMQYVGYMRRSNYGGYPSESIDAPPTLQEVRQARVFVSRTGVDGIMTMEGSERSGKSFTAYAYYQFQQASSLRYSTNVPAHVLNRPSWLARMDTIQFRMEIQRKRTQMFGTSQYITDVAVAPLTQAQLVEALMRLNNSGG